MRNEATEDTKPGRAISEKFFCRGEKNSWDFAVATPPQDDIGVATTFGVHAEIGHH
jgi:hypothetical protein